MQTIRDYLTGRYDALRAWWTQAATGTGEDFRWPDLGMCGSCLTHAMLIHETVQDVPGDGITYLAADPHRMRRAMTLVTVGGEEEIGAFSRDTHRTPKPITWRRTGEASGSATG